MSIYRLDIEFLGPVCTSSFNTIDTPPSIGADRLFSWICLGWSTLFGASSLSDNLIHPFLSCQKPWIHSDLFPCDNDNIFLSQQRTILSIALADLHLSNNEIIWIRPGGEFDSSTAESSTADSTSADSSKDNLNATNSNTANSSAANSETRNGSAGFQPASKDNNLDYPVRTQMVSRVRRSETKVDACEKPPLQKSVQAAFGVRPTTHQAGVRFCSLFKFRSDALASQLLPGLISIFGFLKDEGLGGLRSIGFGAICKITFEKLGNKRHGEERPENSAQTSDKSQDEKAFSENSATLPATKNTLSKYLLLSNCCPDDNMIQSIQSSAPGANCYELQRSSGWIYNAEGLATNIKKPYTFAFTAGSTFSEEPSGKFLDLSVDSYPCYRYGIPFSVRT